MYIQVHCKYTYNDVLDQLSHATNVWIICPRNQINVTLYSSTGECT